MADTFTPEQVKQILEAFFDTVGTRQYIGARYVPIFGRKGEESITWDNSAPYEPLTIVLYEGNSFTSRQYVPAGVDLSNNDYWAETGNFNAQIEAYRRESAHALQIAEGAQTAAEGAQDTADSANEAASAAQGTANTALQNIDSERQARIDAIQSLNDNVIDTYVPFPTATSKFGTLGQVLSTLANGSTEWVDPVIPTDEQAAAGITNWLNQHPEATTTVQDGSIADVKVAPTSGIFRTFANNYHENLDDAIEVNKSFLSMNGTNAPANETQGLVIVLGAPASAGGGVMQLFMNPSLKVYIRRKWGTGAWSDWAKTITRSDDLFEALNTSGNYLRRNTSNATITDLNYAAPNTIEQFVSVSGVSNVPVSEIGLCITFNGALNAGKMQVYMTLSKKLYFRHFWGSTWGEWTRIATPEVLNDGTYVRTLQQNGGISDLNDALPNVIYQLVNVAGIENLPVSQIGICYTISGYMGAGKIQYYVTPSNAAAYYRIYWGNSWSSWQRFANDAYIAEKVSEISGNLLTCFSNITCCGDSLTYSQVYTGASTSRQAYITYPRTLEKLTGVPTVAHAVPGYSASAWWNAFSNNIVTKTNQLAIIYLGTNDGLTDTLDTDCPEGTDASTWANTNTGCYAKIINAFKEAGAQCILVKCYATTGTGSASLAITNSVIDKMGSRFGCAVISNPRLADNKYHYWPNKEGTNFTHYNDFGYAAFTNQLISQVSMLSTDELSKIIPE